MRNSVEEQSSNLYHLYQISDIQAECNKALGVDVVDGIHSYNPVFDRFFVVNQRSFVHEAGNNLLEQQLREMLYFQLETNLRERYHVQSSEYSLDIHDGKLYPHALYARPLEDIYLLGVEYRRTAGSTEQQREAAELEGFVSIVQPSIIGNRDTFVVVISPQGIVEDTNYSKNFIDILYSIETDHGEIVVKACRYDTDMTYDEYKQIVSRIDESYFDGYTDDVPIDAWYLSHPLVFSRSGSDFNPDSFFERVFSPNSLSMTYKDFKEVIFTSKMKQFCDYYIDQITAEHVRWPEVALAFNAILNYADYLQRRYEQQDTHVIYKRNNSATVDYLPEYHMINLDFWGRKPVQTVSAGCGLSTGMSFNFFSTLSSPLQGYLDNSVGRFSLQSPDTTSYLDDPNLCRCGGTEPHFHCPGKNGTCGHRIYVGKGIEQCSLCGQGKTC